MHRLRIAMAAVGLSATPVSAQLVSASLAYPPAALRAGQQGAVGYAVKLAKDGTVTRCRVTQTSGFADLDRATCVQLQAARFRPATKTDGTPIPSTYTGRLRWQIPRSAADALPAAPMTK